MFAKRVFDEVEDEFEGFSLETFAEGFDEVGGVVGLDGVDDGEDVGTGVVDFDFGFGKKFELGGGEFFVLPEEDANVGF